MNIGQPNLEVEQGDTCDAKIAVKPIYIESPIQWRTCGEQAIASYQSKQWYLCLPCALESQESSK